MELFDNIYHKDHIKKIQNNLCVSCYIALKPNKSWRFFLQHPPDHVGFVQIFILRGREKPSILWDPLKILHNIKLENRYPLEENVHGSYMSFNDRATNVPFIHIYTN